jgi:hypothetical protein
MTRAARQRGQGLVELAIALPAIGVGLLMIVGLGLLAEANAGVEAVAGEAARAGALATDAASAEAAGRGRAYAVAEGYGLDSSRLQVAMHTTDFGRGGGVTVDVDYTVPLHELLPVVWGDLPLHREAAEPVDRYRTLR